MLLITDKQTLLGTKLAISISLFAFGGFMTFMARNMRKKKVKIILSETISIKNIDVLMEKAINHNMHEEFCDIMRTSARPRTVQDAMKIIHQKSQVTQSFPA